MKAFQSSISDIYLGSPFREIIILPWKAKKASFKIRGPPNCPSTWFGELSYQQVAPLPHTVYLLHLTLQTCVFRFSAHALMAQWLRIHLPMQETWVWSWVRKIPGEGNSNPFQYSCLGNPMDRSLAGDSPSGHKESVTTERLTLSLLPSHLADEYVDLVAGLSVCLWNLWFLLNWWFPKCTL